MAAEHRHLLAELLGSEEAAATFRRVQADRERTRLLLVCTGDGPSCYLPERPAPSADATNELLALRVLEALHARPDLSRTLAAILTKAKESRNGATPRQP